MANVKISQLPAATTPLGGNEELPLVQNSTTKKALVSSINAKATLQQVTAGSNKNLIDGINLQGSGAGDNNSGVNVIAIGTDVAKNNQGSDVIAIGINSGVGNLYNNVNFFGIDAFATDDNQTVFGYKQGQTIFDGNSLGGSVEYIMPSASGTLVLSVNGNAPDANGDVTISAGSGPQVATVTITSSQLLTINSSPITLVAAPGANKVIMPVNISYVYQYNTSTYTSSLVTARINGIICNSGFDISLSTSYFTVQNTTQLATSTNLINQPVLLRGNNDPTTGDGTLTVTLTYNVINL